MAIDERARRELYEAAEQELGAGPADTLMASLPPVGWADVATKSDLAMVKSDLAAVEANLRLEMEGVEARLGSRIDGLRAEFHSTLRQEISSLLHWTVGTVLGGLIAAVFAIVQIT